MADPTADLIALPTGITISDEILRPRTTINVKTSVGNMDIDYQWDDNSGFTSPIQDLYTNVATARPFLHTGTPPSDMGPAGTQWFKRTKVRDLGSQVDEIQNLFNNATSGMFTISFDGQGPTGAIAFNAAASVIETELELLPNITDVTVTGAGTSGDPWVITFLNPGKQDVAEITTDDTNLVGGTSTISTPTQGDNAELILGTTTIDWYDPLTDARFLGLLNNVGVGFTPTDDPVGGWGAAQGGTVAPDGDVKDFNRYLYLLKNVGVGFDPTDEPIAGWGTGGNPLGGDGRTLSFNRYLYLLLQAVETQPCPFTFSIIPNVARQGDSIVVSGQGLVDATSPTTDPFGAEVRIYETPDLAAAFVTANIVDWTAGDALDTIVAQVPAGATSGHVAVVHTTTPTCSGSNFRFLEVITQEAAFDAGWWIEVWNIRGTQRLIPDVPIKVETAYFQPILNEIGSGWIEIPAWIPDPTDPENRDKNMVDVISLPDGTPKIERLIRVFLDGILRYGFFSRRRSDPYGEKGQKTVRISGPGRESVINWIQTQPADAGISATILNPDTVFGSTVNAVSNGNFESSTELFQNGGFESGDKEPWERVAGAILFIDVAVARTGAFSLRVTPAAVNEGVSQDIGVSQEQHIFMSGWVRDDVSSGDSLEMRAFWVDEDDNKQVLDSTSVTANVLWQQVSLDFIIPTGVTGITVEWRNITSSQKFWIDDNTGVGSVAPWINRRDGVVSLSQDFSADGDFSMKVVTPAEPGAGAWATIGVQPNTKYTITAKLTGDAGKDITMKALIGESGFSDRKPLTGTPTQDTYSVVGVTGEGQTTMVVQWTNTTDPLMPVTFYVDSITAVPGEPAASGGEIIGGTGFGGTGGQLAAAQLRGVVPFLSWDFTNLFDSKGEGWVDTTLALAIRHFRPLGEVFDQLVAFGIDWRITDQYVLQMFNTLGTDFTVFPDSIPILTEGQVIFDGRIEGENPRATFIYAEGAGGINTTGQRADWEPDLERREASISNSNVADVFTLGKLINATLAEEDARGQSIQLSIAHNADVRPYVHFNVGDIIYLDLPSQGIPKDGFRVIAIGTVLAVEGKSIRYIVNFNHLEFERDLKAAAALTRLLAKGEAATGLSSGGGTVGSSSIPTTTSPTTGGDPSSVPVHTHVITDIETAVGGDLGGNLPNPSVVKVRGKPITPNVPVEGDMWYFDPTFTGFIYVGGTKADGKVPMIQADGSVQWEAVAGSSPLMTKGDLHGFSTVDVRIPVGANGRFLLADSADAKGIIWTNTMTADLNMGAKNILNVDLVGFSITTARIEFGSGTAVTIFDDGNLGRMQFQAIGDIILTEATAGLTILRWDESDDRFEFSKVVEFAAGSAAAPSIVFPTDPDTGLFWVGAGNLGLSLNGALVYNFASAIFSIGNNAPGNFGVELGSTAIGVSTGLTFIDFHTGRDIDRDARIIVQGGTAVSDNATLEVAALQLLIPSGTEALPGWAFAADPDTGYSRGPIANSIRQSLGGVGFSWEPRVNTGSDGLTLRALNNPSVFEPIFEVRSSGEAVRFSVDHAGLVIFGANTLGQPAANNAAVGTTALPSFTFAGDIDTGVNRGGADILDLVCGGVVRVQITTTNFSVAIGTTGAAANVHHAGDNKLLKVTSARKYKSLIDYDVAYLADYALRSAKFWRDDDQAWYLGLIADDLGGQDRLLGLYDEHDEIEDYDNRAILAVLVAKVNRLESQIKEMAPA